MVGERQFFLAPEGHTQHDPRRVTSQETCGTDGEFAEEKLPLRV